MTLVDREPMAETTPAIDVPVVDSPPDEQSVEWRHRHLLDVDVLSSADLELVMRTTDAMREVLARPSRRSPPSADGT